MFKLRLKELRKKSKMTQEQLAKAIGLERSSIGKYEGNQGIIPSVEVLESIANYFDVTTDYLLGRVGQYDMNISGELVVAEYTAFNRCEFAGLTQSEIDKLAIYAEGLKAGRTE